MAKGRGNIVGKRYWMGYVCGFVHVHRNRCKSKGEQTRERRLDAAQLTLAPSMLDYEQALPLHIF